MTSKRRLKKLEIVLKKALFKRGVLYVLLACMLLMLVFFFRPFLFIFVFMMFNALIAIFLRPLIMVGIGIEVGVFATVVASCVFGPKVGIIGGLLVLLSKLIFQGMFTPRSLIIIFSHLIIGGLAFLFYDAATMNIATVGIGFTIFHAIFVSVLGFFLLGANIGKTGFFLLTNIPWNIFLFMYLGPTMVHYLV